MILVAVEALVVSPVIFALSTALQLKVVPVRSTSAVKSWFKATSLQTVAVGAADTKGSGFTVTVYVYESPTQPLEPVGMMV